MDYKLILDVIVAILLAATIGYAVMLNTRLNQLRKNRDDLVKLVSAFNDATARAEAGIPKLKRAAEEAGSGLQERVEKAQSLRDDLAFMIERADAMANRLEGAVRTARDSKPAAGGGASSGAAPSGVSGLGGGAARPSAGASRPGPSFGGAGMGGGLDDLDEERSDAERELLRALQSLR